MLASNSSFHTVTGGLPTRAIVSPLSRCTPLAVHLSHLHVSNQQPAAYQSREYRACCHTSSGRGPASMYTVHALLTGKLPLGRWLSMIGFLIAAAHGSF